MRQLFFSLIWLLSATVTVAQSDSKAKEILDKAVEKIKALPAVEVTFDLTMENKEEKVKETHAGKAYMRENKYKIEVMDAINYFDGEVIYTYMPDVEEVNIKNPDDEQDEILNPTILFDIHNQNFNQKLIEEKSGKAYIELTPKEEHKQINKIGVWINTSANSVEKVTSFGKDGNDIIIAIKELKKPATELKDSFFCFDFDANPDVEVIDLR